MSNGPSNEDQLTFWLEERPASHSPSPDCVRDSLTHGEISCSPTLALLRGCVPSGSSGKTSLASCQADEAGTLVPSSGRWANSGMGGPTECWTLNTCEWGTGPRPCRSAGDVCSLSDVLETGQLPARFLLSARACSGILRRAERRGKPLPEALWRALTAVAGGMEETPQQP